MSYQVELVNKNTLAHIKFVEVVSEPAIKEEINGEYSFNLEAHYEAKSDLNRNVLIKVNGQHYQIKKLTKSRSDSITLSVQCEHVSYELIIGGNYESKLEFEDTAAGMINRILQGTRFTLGTCISSSSAYYETSKRDKRKQLVDVANLFGGELYFDNFTVHLVYQRGSDKGLDIKLGVNLLGVTEVIDFVEGTSAYELDLVDLSRVNGYELDFSSAEIGDTIGIIDNVLGINTNERIIAIEYNPFKRQLPTVTVGDYIRDFTEYLKEEEEEKEEEKDGKALFKQFKIGGIDLLEKASDATDDVIDYLTDPYVTGVEVSASYNSLKENLTGIVVAVEKAGAKLTILRTVENDVGILLTTVTELSYTDQLASTAIKDGESIVAVITERPFSDFVADPKLTESAFIQAIGIKMTFSDEGSIFFDKFEVGGESVLNLEGSDVTEVIKDFIANPSSSPIAPAEKIIEEPLIGLNVKPKEEYSKWFLTLIHSRNDGEGNWSHTTHKMPIANFASFKVPNDLQDSVILIISNEPWDNILNGRATQNAYYKAFGATFLLEEIVEPWLEEFKIGDRDCLYLDGVVIEKDDLASIKAEIFYTKDDEFTGLFLKLNELYKDFAISVKEYTSSGSTVHQYADSYKTKKFPGALKAISITISKGTEKQILGIKFTKEGQKDYWLSKFSIGAVDCLSLPGLKIDSPTAASIIAEIEYSKADEFIGLFLALKEEYKDGTISVKNQSGTTINYSNSTVLPKGNTALIVTVTKGQEKQYFGVNFVEKEFEGLIIIKSKDEEGTIISTREMSVYEVGKHEIYADDIYGYELVSSSPVTAELTRKIPEKNISFVYRSTGEDTDPKNSYTLEFGTAPIDTTISFYFENEKGYDSVESVTLGLANSSALFINLAWQAILQSGKYIGVKVFASGKPAGAQVSIQAVCHNGETK